ncbi:MAG: TetR family transcriptional regulator C-terminal domain-containing protein [Candidatus Puniceispirillaceae bacterium]
MAKRVVRSSVKRLSTVEKKARILKAAEKVFAQQGLKGSRLFEIANEAGLPKANLLYYFQSKDDIYRAVCRDILETWLEALGEISAEDNPKKAIESYIKSKMDLSFSRPNASKVFALEIISGAPVIGDYLEKDLKSWVDRQASVFKVWQSRGEMVSISPQHVFFMIWAVTQTYADFNTQITAVLGVKEIGAVDHVIAVETVTEIIITGLRMK